jgi:hypothetical protein
MTTYTITVNQSGPCAFNAASANALALFLSSLSPEAYASVSLTAHDGIGRADFTCGSNTGTIAVVDHLFAVDVNGAEFGPVDSLDAAFAFIRGAWAA